jgi:hypothetical protein
MPSALAMRIFTAKAAKENACEAPGDDMQTADAFDRAIAQRLAERQLDEVAQAKGPRTRFE